MALGGDIYQFIGSNVIQTSGVPLYFYLQRLRNASRPIKLLLMAIKYNTRNLSQVCKESFSHLCPGLAFQVQYQLHKLGHEELSLEKDLSLMQR